MSSKNKKTKIIQLARSKFNEYINSKTGICTECQEFVRGMRPDGSGGLCPHCSAKSSVIGIATAVTQNLIVVTRDKKPEKTPEQKKEKAQRINAAIDKGKKKSGDKNVDGVPAGKKKWTRQDYAKYHRSSDDLSDYTCAQQGIVKKRFKK